MEEVEAVKEHKGPGLGHWCTSTWCARAVKYRCYRVSVFVLCGNLCRSKQAGWSGLFAKLVHRVLRDTALDSPISFLGSRFSFIVMVDFA